MLRYNLNRARPVYCGERVNPTYAVYTDTPTPTKWERFTALVGEILVDNPITRSCCCVGESSLDDLAFDQRFRREVNIQMTRAVPRDADGSTLGGLAERLYIDSGYDCGNAEALLQKEYQRTAGTPDTSFSDDAPVPDTDFLDFKRQLGVPDVDSSVVRMVPSIVANLVLVLRERLGRLPLDNANLLVVRAEYRRITVQTKASQRFRMRSADMVAHEQATLNAYFDDNILDSTALARKRVPGWVKRLLGIRSPVVLPPMPV